MDVDRRLRSNFAGGPPRVTNSGSESSNLYLELYADLDSTTEGQPCDLFVTKKNVTLDVDRRLRSNFAGGPPRVTNSGSESSNLYLELYADLDSTTEGG